MVLVCGYWLPKSKTPSIGIMMMAGALDKRAGREEQEEGREDSEKSEKVKLAKRK